MAGSSIARALGIIIESFSEFLQRLIEGNGKVELDKKELEKSIRSQAGLTLKDVMEQPFSKLLFRLDKINTTDLDRLVVYLYEKSIINDNGLINTSKIMALVNYLDTSREEFSLERNNIKNSLRHKSESKLK